MKSFIIACGLIMSTTLGAQELNHFTFDVGGGFTQPVRASGRNLDTGWNATAGAGFNFSQYVGAMVDVAYNRFDINNAALNNLGFPGGNVGVFSATLNPIIHLTPRWYADVYIIGGGGMYRTNQEFTAPGVSSFTGYNPFFGFYSAAVPTTQVLASNSVVKPGIDYGAGFAIGTKWHGKIFGEARYNRIFMNNGTHMDFIPVTFGFRF